MKKITKKIDEFDKRQRAKTKEFMGLHGFSTEFSLSARFRKHYCPICNKLLKVIRKQQVVNSEDEEASKFDFNFMEGTIIGNVDFRWDAYYCIGCEKEFSIKEVRFLERKQKSNRKKLKGL